jgi:hypothetical protein
MRNLKKLSMLATIMVAILYGTVAFAQSKRDTMLDKLNGVYYGKIKGTVAPTSSGYRYTTVDTEAKFARYYETGYPAATYQLGMSATSTNGQAITGTAAATLGLTGVSGTFSASANNSISQSTGDNSSTVYTTRITIKKGTRVTYFAYPNQGYGSWAYLPEYHRSVPCGKEWNSTKKQYTWVLCSIGSEYFYVNRNFLRQ